MSEATDEITATLREIRSDLRDFFCEMERRFKLIDARLDRIERNEAEIASAFAARSVLGLIAAGRLDARRAAWATTAAFEGPKA